MMVFAPTAASTAGSEIRQVMGHMGTLINVIPNMSHALSTAACAETQAMISGRVIPWRWV